MKLSANNQTKLYNAIADPITDLRINKLRSIYSSKEMDEELFRLQHTIWLKVHAALNLNPTV